MSDIPCDRQFTKVHSLEDKERLVEEPSHRTERRKNQPTQHAERADTRSLLLLAENRKSIDKMIVDPQGAMHGSADEHPAACPAVDVVELLVAVSGAEKERKDGILGAEEEDDGELREGEEAAAVGVRDELGVLGEADEEGREVAEDDQHWGRGGEIRLDKGEG